MGSVQSSPPRALAEGDEVAGATLVEPIAEGERLTCWRAKREDGSAATVHMLTKMADPRERKNFLDGARRLQSTSRSRPIRGVVEIVAIAPMELAYVGRGGAVGSMEDIGVLGWGTDETVAFIRKLCRALGKLHEAGVVHGCLRPANVLIDSELNPRACDVGMLVIDDSYDGPSDMKHDYAAFAARELRLGDKPVVQSDVFSVGRLLYFALLGEEPDEKDEDLPQLDTLVDQPPGLVRIIRRCTTRETKERYPDMKALTTDLENWKAAGEVGLKHPKGKEGQKAEVEEEEAPPPSQRGRASIRASDSAEVEVPEEEPKKPAPNLTITMHREVEEEDILTPAQSRLGGLLGALIIAGTLTFAYVTASAPPITLGGLAIGVIGLGLASNVWGEAPILSRLLATVVFGVTVWLTNPAELVAEQGRRAKLTSGGPLERATRVKRLASRGFNDFSGIDFSGLDLKGISLRGAKFESCRLAGTNFANAELAGASFEKAELTDTDFSGADLSGIKLDSSNGWPRSICDDATVMPGSWVCTDGRPTPERVAVPGALEPVEGPDGEEE